MSEFSRGDMGWWNSALCAQTDPEIFDRGSSTAKKLCRACEVQPECTDDYIETVLKLNNAERDAQVFRAGLTTGKLRNLGKRAAS